MVRINFFKRGICCESFFAACFLMVLGFHAHRSRAEVVSGAAPSAAEWGRRWEASSQAALARDPSVGFISRIAVVQKQEGSFRILSLSPQDALNESFFQIPSQSEIDLALNVNQLLPTDFKDSQPAVNPCERDLVSAVKCLRLDGVLELKEDVWKFHFYQKKTSKLDAVIESKAAQAPKYFSWIHSQLHYDGIVVDSSGPYLLVLLPASAGAVDSQALVLQNSRGKVVLRDSGEKGASLLQLVGRDGRFAVFRAVMTKDTNNSQTQWLGEKIIIEKGKN